MKYNIMFEDNEWKVSTSGSWMLCSSREIQNLAIILELLQKTFPKGLQFPHVLRKPLE